MLTRWIRHLVAYWHYLKGLMHRHWGNTHGLQSEYESALKDFDESLVWDPNFAQVYLVRGIIFWREFNHPQRAVVDLSTAYLLNNNLIEARFNRGVAYQQLEKHAEAITDFEAYLAEGKHPHWREHAESMIKELNEWTPKTATKD